VCVCVDDLNVLQFLHTYAALQVRTTDTLHSSVLLAVKLVLVKVVAALVIAVAPADKALVAFQ
jgi:hypothetical protein